MKATTRNVGLLGVAIVALLVGAVWLLWDGDTEGDRGAVPVFQGRADDDGSLPLLPESGAIVSTVTNLSEHPIERTPPGSMADASVSSVIR